MCIDEARLCTQLLQAGGGRKLAAADSEREVRAALADLGPQHDQEEDRDSQEDSDYYWSDG